MNYPNKLQSQGDQRPSPGAGKRDGGVFGNYTNNPNLLPFGSGSGPKSSYATGEPRPSFHPAYHGETPGHHKPPFSERRGGHFNSWSNRSPHPRPEFVQYPHYGNYYQSAPHQGYQPNQPFFQQSHPSYPHPGNDYQAYPGQYQQYPPVNPSEPRIENAPVKPVVSYNRQPPPVCLGGNPIHAAPSNTIHYGNYGYGVDYSQYNYSGNTQGNAYQQWYYQQQYQQNYQQQYYQQQPPLPSQPPPPPAPVTVKKEGSKVVDLIDDDPEKTSRKGQEMNETVKETTESTQDATKKLADVVPSTSKPEEKVDLDGLVSIPFAQSHYKSREVFYKGTSGMDSKKEKVEEEAYDKMFKKLEETAKPASPVQVFNHWPEEDGEPLSKGASSGGSRWEKDMSSFGQNKGMPQIEREMRPLKKLPLKPSPPVSLSLNQALREGRPLVIIIRGLPGSGKTCAAKLLRAELIDKDLSVEFFCLDEYFMEEEMSEVIENGKTIFRKGLKYKWISQTQEDDYIGQMFQAFRLAFSSNSHDVIIVDAINNSKDHIDIYKDMVESHPHLKGTVLILEMKEMDPAKCFHLCKHNRSLQDIIRLKRVWYRINRDCLWNCKFNKYDYRFLNWDPNRPSDHFLGENEYIESMEKWQETCAQITRENERMQQEDEFREEIPVKRSCPSTQTQEEVAKKPKTNLPSTDVKPSFSWLQLSSSPTAAASESQEKILADEVTISDDEESKLPNTASVEASVTPAKMSPKTTVEGTSSFTKETVTKDKLPEPTAFSNSDDDDYDAPAPEEFGSPWPPPKTTPGEPPDAAEEEPEPEKEIAIEDDKKSTLGEHVKEVP